MITTNNWFVNATLARIDTLHKILARTDLTERQRAYWQERLAHNIVLLAGAMRKQREEQR